MAGVKITDLGILTAPVAEDLLYIVDVSDTSQSPQGTSKQIELGNVLDFESGTFTPTFSSISGSGVIHQQYAFYSRVGSIVTYTLCANIIGDPLEYGINFEVDLPIASAFTNDSQAIGLKTNKSLDNTSLTLYSNDANGKIYVGLTSQTQNLLGSYTFIIQYEVL
jgi:hypothetical protein